jgi:hypothetical protein
MALSGDMTYILLMSVCELNFLSEAILIIRVASNCFYPDCKLKVIEYYLNTLGQNLKSH